MKMRIVYYLFFVFLCVACSSESQKYEGYSLHEKGYYFKLDEFSEGYRKAQISDYVIATIQFSAVNHDSLNITERFVVQILKQDSICLPLILEDVKQGDSISFIVPNTACIRDLLPVEFTDLFKDYKELRLVVKVNSVVDKNTYEQKQKEYEIWLKSQHEFELEYLRNYIQKSKFNFMPTAQGIYKFIIKQGNGEKPKIGDLISINYQGSVLSGEIINHFTSLEFVLGTEWQVVEGIERAIKTMQEGERALILVSSDYAWGEIGTSDKSIAPFTTVQFDIELLSVKKP